MTAWAAAFKNIRDIKEKIMLEVIKKLQMLQWSAYDYDRDQKEIIELL